MGDDFDLDAWILEMIERPLAETVAEMADRVRNSISTQCDGSHAPVGSPPYRETGTLLDSVGSSEPTTTGPNSMEASFGAGPEMATEGTPYDYSADLELGTGKMTGPRPYVLNRADEAADLFIEKFTNA